MRLALAPKATGADQAEVDVDEVEQAEGVGGARGNRHLGVVAFKRQVTKSDFRTLPRISTGV